MKKLIYTVSAVMLIALSSCKNENSVNPRPTDQIIGKVTISGRMKADLVTTNAILEPVPDGIKVVAEISTADLALSTGTGTYAKKYYETTTKSGEYSIDIETGPNGGKVILYFSAFRADVTTATNPVSTLFSEKTSGQLTVVKGKNMIYDINY
jgi:hypothetical protein